MRKSRNLEEHTQFICNIHELSGLFTDSNSLESFLQKIVEMVAEHMHSDVCSIYLYREETQELVLKATTGLNREYVDNIRLKLGEGLTGLSLKELRPICERHASRNPGFRYFPGLGEERFESFLSVPINRGATMIGTMVIQNTERNFFTDADIGVLKAISSQLANTVEMTRLILSIEEQIPPAPPPGVSRALTLVKGKVGSSGFAHGPALVLDREQSLREILGRFTPSSKLTEEDFLRAVQVTSQQLKDLQREIEETLSDVASLIFTAQLLMLKDTGFTDAILSLIRSQLNAAEAVVQVSEIYIHKFQQIPNPYLRQKSQDVADIARRLLENLLGESFDMAHVQGKIVIAEELLPSDALKLSSEGAAGIILLSGGVTSHLSILARSLHLPLVIAEEPRLLSLEASTDVLLDAEQGNIFISPQQDLIRSFEDQIAALGNVQEVQSRIADETYTKDGERVHLLANINLLGDMENARAYKTEGVGLYRTEFPFIVRNDFPSEEEQFVIYQKLVAAMPGRPITFRTLDIGGDKVLSYFEHHLKEKNPYLGLRSIRFSLRHIEIFEQQVRAMLRAGEGADIRIMFPMISSLDEFQLCRVIVQKAVKELQRQNIACHPAPPLGIMVELPAVLEIIDELARAADFFSIGTNDFIQYMLAVDRTNEKVADLYLPQHPAILRALKKIADAACAEGIGLSLCGDMAQDSRFLPYLVGIGIKTFSINPNCMPQIQQAVQQINYSEAREHVQRVLKGSSLAEINVQFGIQEIVP